MWIWNWVNDQKWMIDWMIDDMYVIKNKRFSNDKIYIYIYIHVYTHTYIYTKCISVHILYIRVTRNRSVQSAWLVKAQRIWLGYTGIRGPRWTGWKVGKIGGEKEAMEVKEHHTGHVSMCPMPVERDDYRFLALACSSQNLDHRFVNELMVLI